jgi:hypothetical protein
MSIKQDGTMWVWGNNDQGQVGDGNVTCTGCDNPSRPVQVADSSGLPAHLTEVMAFAGGDSHTLAVKQDGTVWAWGRNVNGQLGNGTFAPQAGSGVGSAIPVQVVEPGDSSGHLTGVAAVAGGAKHSLALKGDGTVWAWGGNDYGQVGNGQSGLQAPGSGRGGNPPLGAGGDADQSQPVQVLGFDAGPTSVDLRSFTATGRDRSILLQWETGSELESAGFHLWRARGGKDNYSRITDGLIPSEGGPSLGAQYNHEDFDVQPGKSYRYKLEDVDASGRSTLHGSVRAAVGTIRLMAPESGASLGRGTLPLFIWESFAYNRFRIQVSASADFSGKMIVLDGPKVPGEGQWIRESSYTPTTEEWKRIKKMAGKDGKVFWRVFGKDRYGSEFTSEANTLKLQK